MKEKKIEKLIASAEVLNSAAKLATLEGSAEAPTLRHEYDNLQKEIYAVQDRNRG